MYDELVISTPTLSAHLTSIKNNTKEYNKFIDLVKKGAGEAHSEDIHTLKSHYHDFFFYDPNKQAFNPPLSFSNKSRMGFNHKDIARALVPIEHLQDLMDDETETLGKILAGEIDIVGTDYPAFMYEKDSYDPTNIGIGFCRGHLLQRAFRCVFTGRKTSMTGPSGGQRKHRPCIASLHGMKKVTPRSIAYIACLTRFTLSKAESWSSRDDAFDYEVFFKNIIQPFEDQSGVLKKWADETLSWWNHEIFGIEIKDTSATAKVSASSKFLAQQTARAALQDRNQNQPPVPVPVQVTVVPVDVPVPVLVVPAVPVPLAVSSEVAAA